MSLDNEATTEEVVTPLVSDEPKQAETNTPSETAADGDVEVKQDEPAKTFTQAEVDAMVQKRSRKDERQVIRRYEQQQLERQQSEARQVTPQRQSFQDDDTYVQAQIEHRAEIRAAEKVAERDQAREAEKRSESFIEKAEKASERYADFQEVVSNPALHINAAMTEFISDSDTGAEVAYYLGKHPEQAALIAQMSDIKAARELTRIESEVNAKPTVKTSNAPAPITPIGNRGSASPSLTNADFSEYKKLRASQGARWAK